MTAGAIAMMIVVCGLVWGGFACLLAWVMRRERGRKGRRPPRPSE